jgi:hypothetical protein
MGTSWSSLTIVFHLGSSSFCVDLIFQEIKPTQNDKKTEKQHVVSWDTPNQGTKASPTMAAT